MLHQSSGGFSGNIQDAEIDWKEWQKVNKILFELLGSYCGKTADTVMKDATRDFWLSAEDAVKYGIIDKVVKPKSRK
jgi:ATP-dependent Clp protease protease subunit